MSITGSEEAYYYACKIFVEQLDTDQAAQQHLSMKDMGQAGEDSVDVRNSDNFPDRVVGTDFAMSSKRFREEQDEEKDVKEADEVHSSVHEEDSESDGKGLSGNDMDPRDSKKEGDIRNSEMGYEREDWLEPDDLDLRLVRDVWEPDRFIQEQSKLYEAMGSIQVVSPEYHLLTEEDYHYPQRR
ncbi:hypothetical protein BT69DRAFT_1291654 [Atractiella rhizophila]|nr:hypothetical protein BT69DRAFT_1291654 [Atractiella rhizophila]